MQRKQTEEDLQTAEDSGFGKKFTGGSRLINSDGTFNILRQGGHKNSIYEHMINVSWSRFFLEILLGFIFVNSLFATLYFINGVENINSSSVSILQDLLNCFYFSIQTFTSVGYGFFNPQNNFANLVASLHAFMGLISFALATGLLFSRFSKARENLVFSKHVLKAPFKDGQSIQFRLVNANSNILMNMEVSVTMTWLENEDGIERRKFHRMPLDLNFIYLFPLNWTVVHKIDENSPFFNMQKEELVAKNAEIIIMVRGYDDTYNQYIFKTHSYHLKCLQENAVFLPMYYTENEQTILQIEKIDEIRSL